MGWMIDYTHSEISFQVRHMMITNVKGHFDSYRAKIDVSDLKDLNSANIYFEFDVASINTKSKERDDHLRSADFFNADKYPKITFQSTSISGNSFYYEIEGDLTIRDITKRVVFSVKYNGSVKNPWGTKVYGFEGSARINRDEFQLTWNTALKNGGLLVSNEIKIFIDLELSKDT